MAQRGLCSRREADALIDSGLVEVNGKVISELGSKVEEDVEIKILERGQKFLDDKVTILINKPIGYVSSQPEQGYNAALDLILEKNHFHNPPQAKLKTSNVYGLAPAGRLDIDSQGLLVLTQNGVLAKHIIGENSPVEKEYLVRFSGNLTDEKIDLMQYGLELDGEPLKKAVVEQLNPDQLRMVLTEGKKRQVRRMCEMMDLKVLGLKRVRIGKMRLGRLPEGMWRFLEPGEEF
jgi:23S rRNA pseudouridine2604 synthase